MIKISVQFLSGGWMDWYCKKETLAGLFKTGCYMAIQIGNTMFLMDTEDKWFQVQCDNQGNFEPYGGNHVLCGGEWKDIDECYDSWFDGQLNYPYS